MPRPGFEPRQWWKTACSQWQRLRPHGCQSRFLQPRQETMIFVAWIKNMISGHRFGEDIKTPNTKLPIYDGSLSWDPFIFPFENIASRGRCFEDEVKKGRLLECLQGDALEHYKCVAWEGYYKHIKSKMRQLYPIYMRPATAGNYCSGLRMTLRRPLLNVSTELYRWTWIWRTQWDQENWSVICKIRRIHMTNTWYASDWDQAYRPSYAKIHRTVVRHIQVHLYIWAIILWER